MPSIRGTTIRRHIELRFGSKLVNRVTRPLAPVSFFAYLRHRFDRWDELVGLHGLESELFPEFGKLSGRELAAAAGVSVPELLAGPLTAGELDLVSYGNEFVIKPDWGSSSEGVLVLRRVGDDEYVEIRSGQTLTGDEVRSRLSDDLRRAARGTPQRLIVEASLATPQALPTDWKFYTFYGRVGLILQLSRSETGVVAKAYSAEWDELGRIRSDLRFDSRLPAPKNPDALIAAARDISRQVPTGFMRVDLYESPVESSVIFGEVSLLPGGDQYYRRGIDRQLGRLWNDATVRLLSEKKTMIP